MRKADIIALFTAVGIVFCAFYVHNLLNRAEDKVVKAGFIYLGDVSNGYTKNFMRAQEELQEVYGNRLICHTKYNVGEGMEKEYIQELIDEGCDIIFGTSYGYAKSMKEFAAAYPNVTFCQATGFNANDEPVLKNYYTYMGHIYEGRYVTGAVAGLKINEMIKSGKLSEDEAVVGYVAAFPYAEVISGYTAFLLGVRSTCPTAVMKVKYSNTWGDYTAEKKLAKELIEEGCVVISQHSDTIGSAVACEEAEKDRPVYHVSYNQSMKNVAPTTSLTGCRINWAVYEIAAVKAMLKGRRIEKALSNKVTINGLDIGAGFSDGWVELLELNHAIAPEGAEKLIEEYIEGFQKGKIEVFSGEYTGVDPLDLGDRIDLSQTYKENSESSSPRFHYILDKVIEIEQAE